MHEVGVGVVGAKVIVVSGFSVAIANLYGDENVIISIIVSTLAGIISFVDYYHENESIKMSAYIKFWGILKSIFMAFMVMLFFMKTGDWLLGFIGVEVSGSTFSAKVAIASPLGYYHRRVIPVIGKTSMWFISKIPKGTS